MTSYYLPNLRVPVPAEFNTLDYVKGATGQRIISSGGTGTQGPAGVGTQGPSGSGTQGPSGSGTQGAGTQGLQGTFQTFTNNIFLGSNSGSEYGTSGNQYAIAIGNQAGYLNQGNNTIALGRYAQSQSSEEGSIAIGTGAGRIYQGAYSTAVGFESGYQSSIYSISLGAYANGGISVPEPHSICINATGSFLNAGSQGLYVAPLIGPQGSDYILGYSADTKEIRYQDSGVQPKDRDYLQYTNVETLDNFGTANFAYCDGLPASFANVSLSGNGQYVFYAGQTNVGDEFYRSIDYGITFSTTGYGTGNYKHYSCKCSLSGEYAYVASIDQTTLGVSVWYSSDYGVTWTNTGDILTGFGQYIGLSCSGNGQYVSVSIDSGLYVSSDFGVSWNEVTTVSTGLTFTNVYNAPMSYNGSGQYQLIASYDSQTLIYVSSNYGKSFSLTFTNGSADPGQTQVSMSASTMLFTNQSGLWISHDFGQSFTNVLGGGATYLRPCISSSGLQIVVGSVFNQPQYSTDGGKTWTVFSQLGNNVFYVVLSGNGQILTASTFDELDFPLRVCTITYTDSFSENTNTTTVSSSSTSPTSLISTTLGIPRLNDTIRLRACGKLQTDGGGASNTIQFTFLINTTTVFTTDVMTVNHGPPCYFTLKVDIVIKAIAYDGSGTQIVSAELLTTSATGSNWGPLDATLSRIGTALTTENMLTPATLEFTSAWGSFSGSDVAFVYGYTVDILSA